MVRDWQQLREDSRRLSVEILQSDADLALTFASSALIHSTPEAGHRSVRHARRAYDYVVERRTQVAMTDADARELDEKIAILRKRLQELGEKFS